TSLAASLCTVTAAAAAPLVVTDARADPRVADLPPVASGAVGAYLGVPLATPSGLVVGALCVFDPGPKSWTERDVAVLGQLAEWAMNELELTATTAELTAVEQRWELATSAAGIGSFDWALDSGEIAFDARMLDLFGFGADEFPGTWAAVGGRIHPDDLPRVERAIALAVGELGTYQAEYRLVLPDGATRWIRARGRVLGNEAGAAVRMLGSALDTTNEKDAEARAVRVLESMSAAFLSLDREWRVTYVNAEAEALLGMRREELLGNDFWETFPRARGTIFEETYRYAVETGRSQTLEAFYPAPLDAWYEARALPSPDGLSISFVDVTARRAAQDLVQLSSEVSERLAGAHDVDEGVQDLAQLVVPLLADWSIVSVAEPGGGLRDVATWHADPELREVAARYSAHRLEGREDESAAGEVVRTAEPVAFTSGAGEEAERVLRSPVALEAIRRLAPESVVLLPMNTGGRRRGALTMLRSAGRPPMSPQELAVAETISQRASMALDNARLFEEQRATAARLEEANLRLRGVAEHNRSVAQALQEAMLTQLPQPDHLELAARYLTASGEEKVGGDWYDGVVLPTGATLVSIGDVAGHDIYAAAVMGQLRNMLRMVAWDRDEPPSAIVARLDRAMRDLAIETTATLVTLRIEQTARDEAAGLRTLRWTSAGHPAPILVLADGSTRLLEREPDVLLGFDPTRRRTDHTELAPPGSTLLLYTDGLVESRRQDVPTGQARLRAAASTHHALGLGALVDAVIQDLVGTDPEDDVAVLAVRFNPEDEPPPEGP
ncbi:MAG: putative sensor protein, partial [Solirubrobacterales bacterium]|nr:putative sensor protein [Solirubrobacterales bacterium]